MQYLAVRVGMLAGALFTGWAGSGCVDARGAYDEFGGRLVDAGDTTADRIVMSELPDVTGDWLMTIRPNLPEDRLMRYRVTYTFTPITDNTGTLAYSGFALSLDTLEPVGDALAEDDIPVGSDGGFDAPLIGTLPAEANAVTGSTVAINARMVGVLINADFICGDLTGQAGSLPLAGTTFAQVRITGDELPDGVWSCETARAATSR